MKKCLIFFSFLLGFNVNSQNKSLDTVAVRVLDRMAEFIGGLGAVSFTADISTDVEKGKYGSIKEYSTAQVFMVGPDKMHVQSNGSDGHKGYWYNGETLVYYSFNENNYSVVEAPSDIITMMDSINRAYNIEFPAADIFFPDIVDVVIENFDHIVYLGEKEIEGENCLHIQAVNKDMNLQLWISNDAFYLPLKYLIIHKDNNTQFEVTFLNWDINPDLPSEMFSFDPPPNARNIAIMANELPE
ncbi:DUF2092 domain-containing protein [Gramella sp. MT6]|uniref:DUF2092 domain-containing protein n=1 Tax=Gramella sp. MT6 TaxID=2705471 RepID=UPI001C5DDAEA|nr:DUF2092 domain-containing protein [Gramella sp. MT6]QYA26756.1 DUF2092 domain-containing protein [Gramella sp. MT6]